jgi:carbon storage regulator CsrA
MLTIRRREGQRLVICHAVVLTVLEVRGSKVRLGINCPVGCPVERQEVYEAIRGWQPPAPRSSRRLADPPPVAGASCRLVLSRRKSEGLVIGHDIVVIVLEVGGDRVLLGFPDCPRSGTGQCPIARQEYYEGAPGWAPPAPRSPEEVGLLEAIRAAPADEVPRLIYADWLEEQGDPRGEFIRVQCALAQLPQGDPRRSARAERERALGDEHGQTWRSDLPPVLRHQPFVRGFVEVAGLAVPEFHCHAPVVFASAPVRHLQVQPWEFWPPGAVPRGMAALLASPYLGRLTVLEISGHNLGDEEALRLAASPHLAKLIALVLRNNRIGAAGASALARSPHLAGLTALDLTGNRVGAAGALALATSPYLTGLTRLDLGGNDVGQASAEALRARFGSALRL